MCATVANITLADVSWNTKQQIANSKWKKCCTKREIQTVGNER